MWPFAVWSVVVIVAAWPVGQAVPVGQAEPFVRAAVLPETFWCLLVKVASSHW